jgi:choline-sulfatase
MTPPNILVFLCDQLRAFEVGCYGSEFVRTPNIDRLAAAGTRFVTAVTNDPVCTPARSILLSGQYSRTCTGMLANVHDNPPNPRRERLLATTLPEALQAAGYRTALFGKWHVDPQPQLVGFQAAIYPDFEHRNYGQRYWNEGGESWRVEEFGPEYELARLAAYLDAEGDEPFFVFYNIGLPHPPIGPGHLPERYGSLYNPAEVPLRPNVPDELDPQRARHWFNIYSSADYFWRHLAGVEQDPDDLVGADFTLRDLAARYCGAVTLVDDCLGAVTEALQRRGLLEETILVFVSDHGDNLGSHGRFNKNALIEEAIRIPFIIRDPRRPGGMVATETVASLVDVMPTVLDLAGVPCPESVQGSSLAPAVRGEGEEGLPRAACIESAAGLGLRTPRYLLGLGFDVETRRPAGVTRFHDLAADPYELTNLAEDETAAPQRTELARRLRAWDAATPWLEAPPPPGIQEYLQRSGWCRDGEGR